MTTPAPLYKLKRMFGGTVDSRQPKNRKHKRMYCWRVGAEYSASVATLLLPYLLVKKEPAKLMIKFRKYLNAHRSSGGYHPLSVKDKNTRDTFYLKMKALNA
jgi:hypothetical protein